VTTDRGGMDGCSSKAAANKEKTIDGYNSRARGPLNICQRVWLQVPVAKG